MKTVKMLKNQRGALLVITLIMLVIISMLGMSTMGTTGLEMQMANNSRDKQASFEAAEYTLSWVESDIQATSFTNANLTNSSCGAICFDDTCSGGYCFRGEDADSPSCRIDDSDPDPYTDPDIWSDSAFHRTLTIPNTTITAKYIIEFRCYTALDPTLQIDFTTNFTRVYRITAYTVGEGGRSRTMLRSLMKEI